MRISKVRDERGFVLLISVILLFITGAVGAAGLLLMVGHYQTTKIQIDHVEAYYRAEAGLVWKMWSMRNLDPGAASNTIPVESSNDVSITHAWRSAYDNFRVESTSDY